MLFRERLSIRLEGISRHANHPKLRALTFMGFFLIRTYKYSLLAISRAVLSHTHTISLERIAKDTQIMKMKQGLEIQKCLKVPISLFLKNKELIAEIYTTKLLELGCYA